MRVLLVDDHRLVRDGIRQMLVQHLRAVVGEADSAEAALRQLEHKQWDVIVLDLTLPGRSGLDLLSEIHRIWPELPVLVLSMHPADQFARRVLNAGALGYLTKDSAPAELVAAIKQVCTGRPFVSASARMALVSGAPLHDALSDREYQVLRMIASGQTVSHTAAEMGISVKTVSTYRARLLDKLHLKTNAELMRYALREGLVD